MDNGTERDSITSQSHTHIVKLVRGWLDHVNADTNRPVTTSKSQARRMTPSRAAEVANTLVARGIYALVIEA